MKLMKLEQFLHKLLLTCSVVVLVISPAKSEEIQGKGIKGEFSFPVTGTDASSTQPLPLNVKAIVFKPTKDIPRISEVKLPPKSAEYLVQSPTPSSPPKEVVEVTGIKVNPTNQGIEIILVTPKGKQLQILPKSQGNSYIADVYSVQLRLPSGNTFRQDKPVAGITTVTVANLNANTIRVIVTGETSLPKLQLFDSREGLIFGFTPTASLTQQKPSASRNEPIEVLVTGKQDRYLVPNSTTGTRTDTDVINVPESIQVIPQQVLRDQQVTNLDEALRNVSGVVGDSFEGRGYRFNIRGFEGAPVLRDGFRVLGLNNNQDSQGQSFADIADIERLEVLRGPASVLFGQLEPGGVINIISKKPLDKPFFESEFQVGNRGFVRPRIDISGPVNSDGSLLYRLNTVYEHDNYFRDFNTDIQRFFIAPVLTWKISDRTDINFQIEYLHDRRPYDTGLVALGNKVANIPYNRVLNDPDDVNKTEFLNLGYNIEHRFSDNWKLSNAFRYTRNDNFVNAVLNFPFNGTLNETTGILNRALSSQDLLTENYALQTNLQGKFTTWSIKHTLLFGVDLARNNDAEKSHADFSNLIPINIFAPVYESITKQQRENLPLVQDFNIKTDNLSVYLQDQISLTNNLILLGGVRYDTVEQTTTNNPSQFSPSRSETTQNNDALTPRIGIVYKPIKNLSLYTSYSRSFVPNSGITASGSSLAPEKGDGYEVGAKTELLDGKLLATLAYFDITKKNVATTDPNNPFFSVTTGEQKSHGVELDMTGEILPGWNIIASYSYINADVTKDNTIKVGNKLPGVPQHSASLWTTYELQKGYFKGLGFGVGFNFVGNRQGDLNNTFELDSYFLTNASVFYRRDNWQANLTFKNIFDVNYIEGTPINRTRGIEPGAPFTVLGSISVKF